VLDDQGQPTATRTEPLAADARPGAEGKDEALLKIIAGLLGVGFNDLKHRELQAARRRLRITRAIAATIGVLALVSILAGAVAVRQRRAAERTSEQLYWESIEANLIRSDYRGIGASIRSHRGTGLRYEDILPLVQATRAAPEFDYVSIGAGMYRLGSAFSQNDTRFAVLGGAEGDQLTVWETGRWERIGQVSLADRVMTYGAATIRGTADPDVFLYGSYESGNRFAIEARITLSTNQVERYEPAQILSVAKDAVTLQAGDSLPIEGFQVQSEEIGFLVSSAVLATPLPANATCRVSPLHAFIACWDSYHIKVFRQDQVIPIRTEGRTFPRVEIPEALEFPYQVGSFRIEGDFWQARRNLSYFEVKDTVSGTSLFTSSLGFTPPIDRSFSLDRRWALTYAWPDGGQLFSTGRWSRLPRRDLTATSNDGRTCGFSGDQRMIQCPGSVSPGYLWSPEELAANEMLAIEVAVCLASLGTGSNSSCSDPIERMALVANGSELAGFVPPGRPARAILGNFIDPGDFWP
jgi:hypothetical protein